MMSFCKNVVSYVTLVPCSINYTVETGQSWSRGGYSKQCGHFYTCFVFAFSLDHVKSIKYFLDVLRFPIKMSGDNRKN